MKIIWLLKAGWSGIVPILLGLNLPDSKREEGAVVVEIEVNVEVDIELEVDVDVDVDAFEELFMVEVITVESLFLETVTVVEEEVDEFTLVEVDDCVVFVVLV